jgi:hypothetical protein
MLVCGRVVLVVGRFDGNQVAGVQKDRAHEAVPERY